MTDSHAFPVMLVITPDKKKVVFLKRALKDTFFVIEAISGADALDWMKNTQINCITLDEKIEDMDALECCKRIRKTSGYAEIPLLLVTGNLKKEFTFQALNAGVTDFLRLPLEPLEVNQRILVAMRSREVEKKMSTLATKLKAPKLKERVTLEARFLLNDLILKQITLARKKDLPLALLLIEVDGRMDLLKKWGAPVVEEISQQLRSLISKRLRTQDALYAQGPGRVLLILPKTSQSAATAIAKSIQTEISAKLFETKTASLALTVSIGMVSFETPAAKEQDAYDQFDRLLARVVGALEKAQETGNKIVYK